MRPVDGTLQVSATNAAFTLAGGRYLTCAVATFGGGSVKLQRLAGDGTTYVSVSSTTDFTAAGCAAVDLPAGTYKFLITTSTAVFATVDRVPGE